MQNWYYQNTQITELPKEHRKSIGFIYAIYFGNGKYYYGQKKLSLSSKKLVAESTAIKEGKSNFRKYKSKKGKNRGKWQYYRDEYDNDSWKKYTSSSKEVNGMIVDGEPYKKEILEFVYHKGALNWREMKKIICSGCMEDKNCLNGRVGNHHKSNIIRYNGK